MIEIVSGLDVAQRWGSRRQLSLASKIISRPNRIVRQYIDGEVDSVKAVSAMNAELGAIE